MNARMWILQVLRETGRITEEQFQAEWLRVHVGEPSAIRFMPKTKPMIWTQKQTPCSLEALLHCYYSPDVHPRFHAPAVRQAIEGFAAAGLVQRDPSQSADTFHYICTERGRAYVEMLCSTPYPTKCEYWKDPRTGEKFGEVEWKNLGEPPRSFGTTSRS